MGPTRSRATCGGVVLWSCFLLAASVSFAQSSGSDGPVDPAPAATTSSSEPMAEGHAAGEGELEAVTAAAFEAWTQAESAAVLRAAITTAEQDFLVQLAALQEQFDSAVDDAAALDLQRRIETLKFEHEVRLVTVQAEHARALGRTELAEEADRQVAQMWAQYRAQREGNHDAPSDGPQTGTGRE